jgi:hypothetical protein
LEGIFLFPPQKTKNKGKGRLRLWRKVRKGVEMEIEKEEGMKKFRR